MIAFNIYILYIPNPQTRTGSGFQREHGYETVETWVQNRRSETDKRVKHIKRLRKKAQRLKNAWKIRKIEGKKIKYSTKTYPS